MTSERSDKHPAASGESTAAPRATRAETNLGAPSSNTLTVPGATARPLVFANNDPAGWELSEFEPSGCEESESDVKDSVLFDEEEMFFTPKGEAALKEIFHRFDLDKD